MDFCDWLKALNYAQVIADATGRQIESLRVDGVYFSDGSRIDMCAMQDSAELCLKGGADDL